MRSSNQVLNFHDLFFINLWFVFLSQKQLIYLMLCTCKQLVKIWIMLLWLSLILESLVDNFEDWSKITSQNYILENALV